MPAMMTGTEITLMLCRHYTPKGCICPQRQFRWWSFRRWIFGHPDCVFDEPVWLSEPDRQLWQRDNPVVCQYITPLEERPE
jgi:hypothetical protein